MCIILPSGRRGLVVPVDFLNVAVADTGPEPSLAPGVKTGRWALHHRALKEPKQGIPVG